MILKANISDALPVPADQELYESVDKVLTKRTEILDGLRAYIGATEPIREVIFRINYVV